MINEIILIDRKIVKVGAYSSCFIIPASIVHQLDKEKKYTIKIQV